VDGGLGWGEVYLVCSDLDEVEAGREVDKVRHTDNEHAEGAEVDVGVGGGHFRGWKE
jgi:hypothetical protein